MMTTSEALEFDIGARVLCKNGRCGKLVKVVLDPHTREVTDLIVEKGLLQKKDRVLPVSVVERAEDGDIYISARSDQLDAYPEYRETEFREPAPDWEVDRYPAEHVRHWISPYGLMTYEPVMPMIRRRVREGIPSDLKVIGRGTRVHHLGSTIGKVDHVLVDPESREMTHLVIRRGVVPDYRILPVDVIERVTDEGVAVDVGKAELGKYPRYRPRGQAQIQAEIEERLAASPLDFSDIRATVEQGVARLTGLVRDLAAKRRAEEIVRSVEGIVDVQSGLDTESDSGDDT